MVHFGPGTILAIKDKKKKATRKGLPLEDMTAEQKKAALALVKAGTSDVGFSAATTIMSLESILKEQEAKTGINVRSPDWYFFTNPNWVNRSAYPPRK